MDNPDRDCRGLITREGRSQFPNAKEIPARLSALLPLISKGNQGTVPARLPRRPPGRQALATIFDALLEFLTKYHETTR